MEIIGVLIDFYNLLNINVGVRGNREFDRGRQTPGKGSVRVSQPQHLFIGLLDWIILCCGGLACALCMFSNISAIYALNAGSSIPTCCDNQNCLQALLDDPCGTKSLSLSLPLTPHVISRIA